MSFSPSFPRGKTVYTWCRGKKKRDREREGGRERERGSLIMLANFSLAIYVNSTVKTTPYLVKYRMLIAFSINRTKIKNLPRHQ